MIHSSQQNTADRLFPKFDFNHDTPLPLNLLYREKDQTFIDLPREDIAFSSKNSYLELDFILTHGAAGHFRYANGDYKRLKKLGLFAFFNKNRLTSSSGKNEEIDIAHTVWLIILISSSNENDLSIRSHRNIQRPEKELTHSKWTKRNYHNEAYLKELFLVLQSIKKMLHMA